MNKTLKALLYSILIALIIVSAFYILIGPVREKQHITWGVNFSQMQAEILKLDWKQTYLAIMEDLKVTNIKLITDWDFVEGKKDDFYFNDIDWQVQQAELHNAKLVYVVGMKTGRWPECHIPTWAVSLSKDEQQAEVLKYTTQVVERYKGSPAIMAWQAENEHLFTFGECPWRDKNFLIKEVALIKSLDPTRPVIVSDSADQSTWFGLAQVGDILGVTMYREAWINVGNYGFRSVYPYPAIFYGIKSNIINALFHKKVIVVEFQAEPWMSVPFQNASVQEQEQSMNLDKVKDNVAFAKKTGIDTFYFWGVEWWYWLKTTQNKPEIWDYLRGLFVGN